MRYLLILVFFFLSKGILQAQACTITVSNPTVSICVGSSAVITANINNPAFEGAPSYSWSNGVTTASVSLNPTSATVYTVTGIAGGCTLSTTVSVIVKALPTIVISPASPTVCFSSALTLTASGATTYTWSTGPTTSTISVTPTANTTYTATGTDANGCVNSTIKTVTVNPNVILTNSTPTICMGSSAPLVASGATTYSWSTGATTASISVSPTVATTYTVKGTSGACSKVMSTTVTPIALPNTTVSASSSTVCAGGSVTLTASGATTYSWSTGATTTTVVVTPTANTTYTVKGTSNSCSKTVSITITRIALPTIAIAPTSPTVCNGSAIILTASGASTYTWNTGPTTSTISLSPTVTTSYSVTATATTGCVNTAVKAVTVVALPNVTISNPTPTVCAGKPRIITASGATTYSWNTSATTASISVSPTVTTNYTVTGTTAGCAKTATTTISVTALPTLTISPATATICNGSSVTLTGSGASTYTWNTGPTTTTISLSPTVTTNYTLTGTAASGCSNTAVRTVTVSNSLVATNPTPSVCIGTSTILTVSGASTYSWSTGATTSSISVTPTVTTTYTVKGTTDACVKTISITVTVRPIPSVGITRSTPSICVGVYATLTGTGATTYNWSTGAATTSISVSPTVTTIYTVTGMSAYGCTKTATTSIDASCTYNYNSIGYKTAWTNFSGTVFRHDSILIDPLNFYDWPNTVSKNTLKANTNGWVEAALSTEYLILGFHDSTSVTHNSYTDIDYGFYKQLDLFYLIIEGGFYNFGTINNSDIVRIDRTGDVLTYKINGVVQFTTNGIPTNKNWKLKTAILTTPISNIGASFVDSTNVYFPNYIQDNPKIIHCTPGQNNGSISLTPKITGTQTFTWSTGSNNASVSGLSVGDYNVDVKDSRLNLSHQKYSIGYKTNWINFFGLQQRSDSLMLGEANSISWPYAISKNTLKANTDGWAQVVFDQNTDYLFLGFHDSTSAVHHGYSDIDFGIYKQLSTLYIVIEGSLYVTSTCAQGDVVKIERTGNTFYIKINGATQFETTVSAAKTWKLKASLNNTPIANIGASFTDSTNIYFPNYVQNNAFIKNSQGVNINNGEILLSPKIFDSYTYSWLPNNETLSKISNKSIGAYNVTITDAFANSSKFKYDILYKANWENFDGCFARQDSLISSPTSTNGWNTANSKNILNANTDGEISWIAPNTQQHQIIGFADTLSGIPDDLNDIDNGLYIYVQPSFTLLYQWLNGSAYNLIQCAPGDIIKIKRKQDTLIYLLNDAVVTKFPVLNSNVNWKVKAAFSNQYNCGDIGCSFNSNFKIKVDKEHANYDNPINGVANITPVGGIMPDRYLWNDGSTFSTRTNLVPGRYNVVAYADATDEAEAFGQNVSIGTKPYWKVKRNSNANLDSVWVKRNDSLGLVVSENMIDKNSSGELELKIKRIDQNTVFGLIGSNMKMNLADTIVKDSILPLKINQAYSLARKAFNDSLSFYAIGGVLNLGSSYNDINFIQVHNGQIKLLINGSNISNIYSYRLDDVLKIGRNALTGNIFIARNDTVLYKHSTNTNSQYLLSSVVAKQSSEIANIGVIGGPIEIIFVTIGRVPKMYAELKEKLDGSYYLAKNNQFFFKYIGQYIGMNLNYKLFDNNHNPVTCQNFVQSVGDNRFILNFSSCASSGAGFYTLEVTNEKNEKSYLKILK